MRDPQQEVFSTIRQAIAGLGYSVYDTGLPPPRTKYPFVYLGYTQQIDERTNTQLIGTVYQQVDIWHDNAKRRGDLSAMMLAIKQVCFSLKRTESFSIDVTLNDQSIRPDRPDGGADIVLVRGKLEFKIQFS